MIHSMYAKLFSRIAQSSLMEEPIETRYTFMMLLAIADQSGDVIGTDVALARTINLPLTTFTEAVKALMEPDPHSNSQDQEGRRLVPSENGRGYRIVNYTAYRAIKTAEEKKTYMREYMRARRESLKTKDVTDVNICKSALSDVTHTEAEAEAEFPLTPQGGNVGKSTRKKKDRLAKVAENSPLQIRIGSWFGRKPSNLWMMEDAHKLVSLDPDPDDLANLDHWFSQPKAEVIRVTGHDSRQTALATLLNNWQTAADRARAFKADSQV